MSTPEPGEKLRLILQRVDSRLLSKLWLFYRDYFKNDESCLEFLFRAVRQEPVYTEEDLEKQFFNAYNDDNFVDPDDHLFIPRRMLNCVERMVSAARDMEQIRQVKDAFKIVFLVTCVETLQKLSGKDGFKKDMDSGSMKPGLARGSSFKLERTSHTIGTSETIKAQARQMMVKSFVPVGSLSMPLESNFFIFRLLSLLFRSSQARCKPD